MKNIFTLLVLLYSFSVLHAQNCVVQITATVNPNVTAGYTFKTDLQPVGSKYLWSFGDNATSDMIMPTHSFRISGNYTVQVTVTGADGSICSGSLSQQFDTAPVMPPVPVILTGKGKVSKLATTDPCGLSILMSTGETLIPVQVVPNFEFKDGQYVEIAYEIHQELSSGCTVGIPVKIDRISEIITTPCLFPITYVKNVPSATSATSYTFKTDPQADGAKFMWSFGDNTNSDMVSPTHTFGKTDSYVIQLKITSKDGKICYGELKDRFDGGTVPPPPVILTGKGKVTKTTGTDACALSITLANGVLLIPSVVVPTFEFKDGQYVELAYELLTTKPSCPAGISAKIDKVSEIIVPTVCKVPIVYQKGSTTPTSYNFSTDVQPSDSKFYWRFGDGGTSELAAPVYSFKKSGTWIINLKIVDAAGNACYGEIKAQFDGASEPAYTVRGIVKKSTSAGCDLVIVVENTILIPVNSLPDFTLTEGQRVELTFEKLAEKVSTCKDGTDIKLLAIKEITTSTECRAYFSATNIPGTDLSLMKKMTFTNFSIGEIKNCNWAFGDRTTSTDISPTHEYAAFGEYKVCLLIETTAGCKTEYCKTVKVENKIENTFCKFNLVIKPKDSSPYTYLFAAVSQADINAWKWDFGDGTTSDLKYPEHAYDKAGVYVVSCTISTSAGCTETMTAKNYVLPSPLPDCSGAINMTLFDPTNNMCNGKATVKLLDADGNEITNATYLWSDSSSGSTIENLCQDKPYSVQASVEGVCQKSYSFTFLSKPIWRASTINGQNTFTVVDPKEGIVYEWNFGNGTVLTGAQVTYSFPTDGVYDVKLKAASGANFSELTQQVVVMNSITGTEIINKSEIEVYPNPVNDMLRINFGTPVSGKLFLEILNVAGQRSYSQQIDNDGFSQVAVNVQLLKKGVYFLRVSNGKLVIADRKFIKAD